MELSTKLIVDEKLISALQKTKIFHEGEWQIRIDHTVNGWCFDCLLPDGASITDHTFYADFGAAVLAAQKFTNKAIRRLELGNWLDSLLDSKRITIAEWADATYHLGRLSE
jgi:hypothetical protein